MENLPGFLVTAVITYVIIQILINAGSWNRKKRR